MSNIAQRIKGITGSKVKAYLESGVTYRDNDEVLLARFWYDESTNLEYKPATTTAVNFLKILAEGKLTSSEEILRARRRVQEKFPELRGTKWEERHKKEKEVKREINES